MSWREWDDENASSPTLYFGGADDRVFRVVAAFDDDVRTKVADKIERSIVGKNNDKVDTLERGQDIGALGIGAYGASWTFKAPHRIIAVDPDHERFSALTRRGENIDVPRVKQVEHTIRECYPAFPCSSPSFGLGPRRNLFGGISRLQSLLRAEG